MNIQQEISSKKEELLADLSALVSIRSVLDETSKGENAPFGKGVREAFDSFIQLARRLGFHVRDLDGYALDAQIGTGDEYIGILGHLDVVEAKGQEGWESDPFVMRRDGDLLYGRGVNDDKGPLLAALYAASLIKEQGLELKYPIRIIAGGAEETTWECMEHYFRKCKQPVFGFSPDGNFPIVNGEKGILQVRFLFPAVEGVTIQSSPRTNYVCDDLQVFLPSCSAAFARADQQEQKETGIFLRYKGKTALSRNPQRGDNAIFHFVKDAAENGKQLPKELFLIVEMIQKHFLDDHNGEKSQLASKDPAMGENSVCLMSMNSCEEGIEVCIDIRYVKSTTKQQLWERVSSLADRYQAKAEIIREKRLLYVDEDSPLILALKTAYQKVMHEKAEVFTKGGASYARVLDQGVAFGATFDGEDTHPHMANECQKISSLLKACEIYYESLVELAVKK